MSDRLDAWAALGYGEGEVEIDDGAADEASTADLTQRSLAAGLSATAFESAGLLPGGRTAVRLKAEGSVSRSEVEAGGDIAALTADAAMLRLAAEASHERRLASGGTLAPSLEAALRHDGGDGETGTGIEVGAGLRWRDPATGLTAEGNVRTLLGRGDREEWGAGGFVRFDPGADGRGLSFGLAPSWGAAESGAGRLWEDPPGGDAPPERQAGSGAEARLEAELGWGFALPGGGLLTPHAGASVPEDGARRYGLGARLQLAPAFSLGVEAERRDAPGGPERSLMLRGHMRW